jgi:hypothetical protein
MGSDFARSVTDVNGRFHHVSNAHCVEQSIFPTVGSANPVLTGIALSRKIAESIIDRYTSVEFLANEPGFAPLYSGSLAADGWKIASGGSQNFFDVSDQGQPVLGAGLDNRTPDLGVAWYASKMFKDFILKLDWRAFDNAANSGIFLRMPEPGVLDAGFYDSTIEVQIDEHGYDGGKQTYGSPLHKTGAVYEVFPAQLWAAKAIPPRGAGESTFWNRCEIEVQGASIGVQFNGLLVSKGQLPGLLSAHAPSAGRTKRETGYIGLQCHTEVVQFRNIRIKEL